MPGFVSDINADNELIDGVLTWPLWSVLESDHPANPDDLTADDLALFDDADKFYTHCLSLADNRADVADRFFGEELLSSIYRKLAVKLTHGYRPPYKPAANNKNSFE